MEINGNTTLAEMKEYCVSTPCTECPFETNCHFGPKYWNIEAPISPKENVMSQSAKADANKPRPTLIDMGILEAVSSVRRAVIVRNIPTYYPAKEINTIKNSFQNSLMEYSKKSKIERFISWISAIVLYGI